MSSPRNTVYAFALASIVMLVSGSALADWDPGDTHKMHFPQMPDPTGWDVMASDPIGVADDWKCSETGPVNDIHIWGSWQGGLPGYISQLGVAIFSNIPADAAVGFSRPGEQLWNRDFSPNEFTIRDYGDGDEGWYEPNTTEYIVHDHNTFHQINIQNIRDAFIQEEGTIYWLGVKVELAAGVASANWGWKTSLDHYEDDAVWTLVEDGQDLIFNELRDPITGESLDLAFVITPEPATLAVLLLGALGMLKRRK